MGDGLARWVMGVKEGACWDEHWALHVSDESPKSTPETNIVPYDN